MTKKHRSDAFAAIDETMEGLHDIGAVDKETMRENQAVAQQNTAEAASKSIAI